MGAIGLSQHLLPEAGISRRQYTLMSKTKTLLSTVAALTLLGSAAHAELTPITKTPGGWFVGYETMDDGSTLCEAAAAYKSKAQLTIGKVYHRDTWMLLFENPSWNLLVENDYYEVTLETPSGNWNVKFQAGKHSLFAMVDKELINALAMDKQGKKVNLFQGNTLRGSFELGDSAAGVRGVVQCVKAHPAQQAATTPPTKPEEKGPSFGSGFFVADHYVITNHHVVKDCHGQIHVKYPGYRAENAYVQAIEPANDLLLLKTDLDNGGVVKLRYPPKLGEQVESFGFPYGMAVSSYGAFTTGNVTSTVGVNDDTSKFQMSAPIQPGNSGGPIMDGAGRVLGVSEFILSTLQMSEAAGGAIPQNVNFAISSVMVANFLILRGIDVQTEMGATQKLDPEKIAEIAQKFTVQVACE
jgi:S1-C subfamily serine protease